MTVGASQLNTLCRLRTRDLDRARKALADAIAHQTSCEAAVLNFQAKLRQRHIALEAARAARCAAPADEMVQLVLERRERELAETQALLDVATQKLADAAAQVRDGRLMLLRAQARDEATAGLYRQALRDDRRRRDRSTETEREDHRRRA